LYSDLLRGAAVVPCNCHMIFTTVVSLPLAVKMSSIAEIYTHKLTYDSCVLTIRNIWFLMQHTRVVKRITTFSFWNDSR